MRREQEERSLREAANQLEELLRRTRVGTGTANAGLWHRIAELASEVAAHAATLAAQDRPVD